VLAVCLGVGWATALVISSSSRTPPINDTTADLLSAIGGVLAGAITAYIGGYVSTMRRRGSGQVVDPDHEDDEQSEEGQ